MNTVIWDEGELHTLQLHNFFFYYFLSFWFELQLPKLALVFCAQLGKGQCGFVRLVCVVPRPLVNQPLFPGDRSSYLKPAPFLWKRSSELCWQVLPLCNR